MSAADELFEWEFICDSRDPDLHHPGLKFWATATAAQEIEAECLGYALGLQKTGRSTVEMIVKEEPRA